MLRSLEFLARDFHYIANALWDMGELSGSTAGIALAALWTLCNIASFLLWIVVRGSVNRALGEIEELQEARISFREFRIWVWANFSRAGLIDPNFPAPNGD